MKTFLQRFAVFMILPFIFGVGVVTYNITLDPYGVIRGDMENQRIEPNQHYLKTKHVLDNPKKHNSFLFGSSRVGKIDIRIIEDGDNWYNMSYSQGVPAEHLAEIKLFLQNNVEIKNIWIGLEETSYLIDKSQHKSQANRKSYVNRYNPWLSYLFIKPSPSIFNEIRKANDAKFYTKYSELYNSGVSIAVNVDDWINTNLDVHKSDPKFKRASWNNNEYNERIDGVIDELSEIVSICNENGISLKLFINPMFVTTYMRQDKEEFFEFLRKLSSVSEFYDFSGVNKITTDPYYYYESSHFRPLLGYKIIDVLANNLNKTDVKEFGKLISSDNINYIINQKDKAIRQYLQQNSQ